MYPGQLEAWLATLATEGVAAALLALLLRLYPPNAAAAAIGGSLLSHPIVWWMFFQLRPEIGYWPTFTIVETFAVASEIPFYRLAGAGWGKAALLSLLVNAVSMLWGLRAYLLHQMGL